MGDPVDASDLYSLNAREAVATENVGFILEVLRTNCDLKLSRISAFTH